MEFLGLDVGSWADWVSGIGSFVAIIFIYIQIKQSDQHQRENLYYNFKIAIGQRRMVKSDGISSEYELIFWGTNDGHVSGSFKFIGFCTPDTFDYTNKEHISGVVIDTHKKIEELDSTYSLGIKCREFEKVESGGVSSEITVPMNAIDLNYKENETVCVVYMDPLGKLYKNDLLPRDEED